MTDVSALELRIPHRLAQTRSRSGLAWVLAPLPSLVSGLLLFGAAAWEREVWLLVGLTALAHLLAFLATERMARYPGQESWSLAGFNLLLFTLFLVAVLAMGRLYYSRSYLLAATLLAFLLLLLYLRGLPPMRLALLPGGVADGLLRALGRELPPLRGLEGVEGVVADLHRLDPKALPLLAEAAFRGLPILHAANVYEGYTGRVPLELAEGLFALAERDRGLYPLFKRAWEVGLVLLLSPLALLVGFLVALAVYLDLGRPILFAQERVGLGGRVFRVYKFRTMRGEPREGAYAGEEQDRIAPLGRFLRRYRLDELPQLWNVLKGEMSLVGPRPEQRVLAEAYAREIPLYPLRHTVRPGLTGWAQVHQGYAEGKEETLVKLSYDLYYIKHLSFFLDLRILLRTVFVVLSGFRAR
ncbi:glycosyl transferase [Thermus scotoductus]|uniref:Glycosyl transferase n=1 Tax=Thermus scotoductus TaxID=37636 RepID=A0A430SDN6_THESC|nr:sugar transferase [Thermus scotoductus]RTG94660.1 glycosyl transferase [Thermus scotoductus]RTH06483.1 glycosyl transferase [Thermus scotoductus]RTH07924.1 glycosyl transferase [Thermus scotoductus]RTH09329.1 glycosyl transferase [Thermus scotoductus]RTH16624.1 glycosyl transferase [Thermus scotoductus]